METFDPMTVQINYKSGTSMLIVCDKVTYDINGDDQVTKLEFTGIVGQRPLVFGLREIESVWRIK